MMRKLRNIKKFRVPMIVMIVVLSVGLVGSFTLMGTRGTERYQGAQTEGLSTEEQIEFLEKMLAQFNETYDANPNDGDAIGSLAEIHWNLAQLYEDEERQSEHLELSTGYYHELADVFSDDAETITHVAVQFYRMEDNDTAQSYFQKALDLDENNIEALVYYGIYNLNSTGDFEEALGCFDKALEQEMNDEMRDQIEGFAELAKELSIKLEEDSRVDSEQETENQQ